MNGASPRSIWVCAAVVLLVGVAIFLGLGEIRSTMQPLRERIRTRAVVRVVPFTFPVQVAWRTVSRQELPGRPYPLDASTMSANELSGLVARASHWTTSGMKRLEDAFSIPLSQGERLLVYRVDIRVIGDRADTDFTPVALLTPDSSYNRPSASSRGG